MPVYNGEEYLCAALDGLVRQTFTDFELIISDNASTDSTESICREYAARNPRIRYIRNARNVGGSANFNRVLALATGKYFKWACHDDLHAPSYIERCVEVLEGDSSVVLCHSKTEHIDRNGVRIDLENHPGGFLTDSAGHVLYLEWDDSPRMLGSLQAHRRFSDMLTKPYACVNTFGLIRTDVLKSTPCFQPYFGSERLFLAELALIGRFHRVPESLFSWRIHVDQATRQSAMSRQRRMAPNTQRLARAKFLPGYCRALWKVPMPLTERALCHLVLFSRYAPQFLQRSRRARRTEASKPVTADAQTAGRGSDGLCHR